MKNFVLILASSLTALQAQAAGLTFSEDGILVSEAPLAEIFDEAPDPGSPPKKNPRLPEKRREVVLLVRGEAKSAGWSNPTQRTLTQGTGLQAYWYGLEGDTFSLVDGRVSVWNQITGGDLPGQIWLKTNELRGLSYAQLQAKLALEAPGMHPPTTDLGTGEVLPPPPSLQPSDVNLLAGYLRLVSQDSQAGVDAAFKELTPALTWNEKISLVQVLGQQGLLHYDNGLNAFGNAFGNSMSYSEYYAGLKRNVVTDSGGEKPKPFVVCRQVAIGTAHALHEFGAKNTYILSYNSGTGHTAAIAQNPLDPKQILHFNYGGVATANLSDGNRSLTRGEDYTLLYLVMDHAGKSVANLPSELGTLVAEGQGLNLRTLDPFLYRPQGSIVKLGFSSFDGASARPGLKKTTAEGFDANVFSGRTSSGDFVYGVGGTGVTGNPEEDVFSQTSSVGLAYQEKDARSFDRKEVQHFTAVHLQILGVQQLNTPWVHLKNSKQGPRLQARLTGQSTLQLGGALTDVDHYGKTSDIGGAINESLEVGFETRFQTADEKTRLKARVASQYAVGVSDITSQIPNMLYRNVAYAFVTGETSVLPQKLNAGFEAGFGVREFGSQILLRANVGDADKKWKVGAGYQGALNRDAFTIARAWSARVSSITSGKSGSFRSRVLTSSRSTAR